MEVHVEEIQSDEQIGQVAELANTIWHEHYNQILSINQIDYMLASYQSEGAIRCQLQDGYHYFGVIEGMKMVGYLALKQEDSSTVFISKIYILAQNRGKGYGNILFEKAFQFAREKGCHRLYLTVNRNNQSSVNIYRKKGFTITKEVDEPIGDGFEMNDYVMDCSIS